MSLLITICARGGSKGIPGKNIRMLGGRPLIDYSLSVAKKFASLHNGITTLSTDSPEIRQIVAECGLKSDYKRPEHHATDNAGKIDTIKDVLLYEEQKHNITFDFILDLDVTSPLRTIEDLEEAYFQIRNDKNATSLFSVNKAARNPYFNMVEVDENGYCHIVKTPALNTLSRQSAPPVYELNASFYFYRRSFFDSHYKSPITDNSLMYLMNHLCFDLDHPIDFEFMEYLIINNKLDFRLI